MPQLLDNTDTQFAYPVHRQLLNNMPLSTQWYQSIHAHASKLQHYLAVVRHRSFSTYLATSPQSGQLLAESIHHHCGYEKNLIFCEKLPYHKQVMVVIIRNHQVYLEARIHENDLLDEISPLLDSKIRFKICTSLMNHALKRLVCKIPHDKVIHHETSIIASLEKLSHTQLHRSNVFASFAQAARITVQTGINALAARLGYPYFLAIGD